MDLALLRKLKSMALNRALSLSLGGGLLLTGSAAAEHCLKKEPERPQTSPACEPAWGFHETCWKRFPPLAECDSSGIGAEGCSCMNGGDAGFARSSGDGSWLGSSLPSAGFGYESGRYGASSMKPQHVYHNDPGANTSSPPTPAAGGFGPMTPPPPVPMQAPATGNPIPSAPVPQTPPLPQSRYHAPATGVMRNVSMQRPVSQGNPRPFLPPPANAAAATTAPGFRHGTATPSSSRYGLSGAMSGAMAVSNSSNAAAPTFTQRLQANTAQRPAGPAGTVTPATAVVPASGRYSVRPGSPAQVRLPIRRQP